MGKKAEVEYIKNVARIDGISETDFKDYLNRKPFSDARCGDYLVDIGQIMNLHFELNNHILIIFFLNLPYWLVLIALKLSGKRTTPSPAPS